MTVTARWSLKAGKALRSADWTGDEWMLVDVPAKEVGNEEYAANVQMTASGPSYIVFTGSDGLFYAQAVAVASDTLTMGTDPTPSRPRGR